MENREPFKLKGIILAYNLFQTLFRFSTQSKIRENTSTTLFYAMVIRKIYLVIPLENDHIFFLAVHGALAKDGSSMSAGTIGA